MLGNEILLLLDQVFKMLFGLCKRLLKLLFTKSELFFFLAHAELQVHEGLLHARAYVTLLR